MNDIPDELKYDICHDKIRFSLDGLTTNWMGQDDPFIGRIRSDKLNPVFLDEHLLKEIEMKNILDKAFRLVDDEKYSKAIGLFDEVLFYDDGYVEALFGKSRALEAQGHFVKALRYYKRAAGCGFEDAEYYRTLLGQANDERNGFPKLKLNIYAGDEHFSKGEFEKACESYDKALVNPSKFKDMILFKLLNKKATALMHLERFDEALACFDESLDVKPNDYAYFGQGYAKYELGKRVGGKFKSILKIDKKHMLKQALILNDKGFFKESLAICDFLFENHFRTDDFYFRILAAKRFALGELGSDLTEVDEIIDKIS